MHIPLQSGSDKILKLMNRPYNKNQFKAKIDKLKKVMPLIAITTDVIVGFPGEGEAEFEEVCNFINEINFSKLHVFSFSAHEKTPAFIMPDHVAKPKIAERSEVLHDISDKAEASFRKKFIGQELEVIVEKSRERGKLVGKTEYYFDIDIVCEEGKQPKIGTLVKSNA
jgi:threonylcarbamoyladenosine tRNA methylthiotransferase MtaB